MNGLLIITQKVDLDDEALGFAHRWYLEFAKHFERVTIICLAEGRHQLPDNIRILSLGKERGNSRLERLRRLICYSFANRHEYRQVFVHMNPIYVLLMGIFWRLTGKRVSLWYAHGHVDLKLRLACALAHQVFTSTAEGLRVRTGKQIIVGQGIDTDLFRPGASPTCVFTVATVGRMTASKNVDMLIRSFAAFASQRSDARFLIAGSPGSTDAAYAEGLQRLARELGMERRIQFVGSVRNADVPEFLRQVHLFINASTTGSLDKAVLEAMACGVPVLSSNDAVCALLRSQWPSSCVYHECRSFASALGIFAVMPEGDRFRLGRKMATFVHERFGVEELVHRIVAGISSSTP